MNISQRSIGSIGTVPITVPVITVGSGAPVVSIVTGLHGDEESGLLIIRGLLMALKRRPLKGMLRILPSGNPLTQAFKTRFSPIDNANPNRVFPGKKNGDLSQRIAAETISTIRGSAAVIDLHCFGQDCAFTGILVLSGSPDVIESNKRLLKLLSPECVWVERSATPDGESIRKNLGGYLGSIGVPNIAVEMPRADRLSPALQRRIVAGMVRVVRGALQKKLPVAEPLLAMTRNDVRADASGMFIPLKKPLTPLSRGTPVGRLVDPVTFRETVVRSPRAGRLFLIARQQLVRTGDKLFAIGTPVRFTTE